MFNNKFLYKLKKCFAIATLSCIVSGSVLAYDLQSVTTYAETTTASQNNNNNNAQTNAANQSSNPQVTTATQKANPQRTSNAPTTSAAATQSNPQNNVTKTQPNGATQNNQSNGVTNANQNNQTNGVTNANQNNQSNGVTNANQQNNGTQMTQGNSNNNGSGINSTSQNEIKTVDYSNWPEIPDIKSGSAILIDADTGAVLYDKNSHARCYPASTTKILTGLLAIENCNMSDIVTFSSTAANSINIFEDANIGAKPGEEFTVEQTLHALLLYSANEIAYGIAEHVSGTAANFAQLMNQRAAQLGAVDTHFNNASGLDDPNHYTTAYDMAMIAKGCYNNSTFVSIDSTTTNYTIPPTNKTDKERIFKHRHEMLAGRGFAYEYCKGGKTGFTDISLYTLVTFAEKDNMRLIAVTFQSPSNETRYEDTTTLFEWGFKNFNIINTADQQIATAFTNNNYYNSVVFSKLKLNYTMDASNLTLPSEATIGDVRIGLNNKYAIALNSDSISAYMSFLYGNNTVGATKLTISSVNAPPTSLLPYTSANDTTNSYKEKFAIKINIWFIVGLIIVIFILLRIKRNNEMAKRRYNHARPYQKYNRKRFVK